MGTGRCGGGRYGGGHYGGRRYGGGRYGGAFLKGVDATAEPPDTHFTMDAAAEIRRFPCSIKLLKHSNITNEYAIKTPLSVNTVQAHIWSRKLKISSSKFQIKINENS